MEVPNQERIKTFGEKEVGTYTNQNPSWKKGRIKFLGILRYKQIN